MQPGLHEHVDGVSDEHGAAFSFEELPRRDAYIGQVPVVLQRQRLTHHLLVGEVLTLSFRGHCDVIGLEGSNERVSE